MNKRARVRAIGGLSLAVCLAIGAGCDERDSLTGSEAGHDAWFSQALTTEGDGFMRVDGEKAGALFAVIRPDDWNGDLVVLMHGYVEPDDPIQLLPSIQAFFMEPVIDALVQDGFGVALSSYRANGWTVKEGTTDTRVAQAMFTAHFGRPNDTYLYGWSMGTEVGQRLVETSPEQYAGFLSVCGGLGGAELAWEYIINARILFDYFFPDVLPGDVWMTQLDFFDEVIPRVVPAIQANPLAAVKLASVDQLAIRWNDPTELAWGIVNSLLVAGGGAADLVDKANGIPLDNTATLYTSPLMSPAEVQALNEGVQRFEADPQAARFLQRYYVPDGKLGGTPVLAFHATRDAVLPAQVHGSAYERILADAGNEGLFVQRLVDGFGHCDFGSDGIPDAFIDLQLAAFEDLVLWARTGVKPVLW